MHSHYFGFPLSTPHPLTTASNYPRKVDEDYPDNKLSGAVFEVYSDTNGDGKLDKDDTLLGEMKELDGGVYQMSELRYDMSAFARHFPESAIKGNYCTEYGFRVNTEKHAFLLRCNPTKGDYNFYCYCYVKEWLDKHIQKAEQGIRFIDPQYKEMFRIPDGGKVIVTTSWGEKREYPCRFIDEYHTEVGSNLYHICEFAERMQKNGATYEPKPAEQTSQKTPKHKDLER